MVNDLKHGYSRLIQLCPGLEINIEQYQLRDHVLRASFADRVIMTQCDRIHSLEMSFLLRGQNYARSLGCI
jgi:hypothetical protein